MKILQSTSDNNMNDEQEMPKFRNIHDEKDIIEEKPEGVDKRIKISIVAIIIFTIIVGIKGSITKSSLTSQLEEQTKLLDMAQAEALVYGITEDEDGDLVIPVTEEPVNVSDLDWDSIEQRNIELLVGSDKHDSKRSFTELLLNWEGQTGYEKARQELIDYWGFTEDSALLSSFMTSDGKLNGSMKLPGRPKVYVLSNDGKNMSYFLICEVRYYSNDSEDKTSVDSTIGIHITVNEDGTISDVIAQTLS